MLRTGLLKSAPMFCALFLALGCGGGDEAASQGGAGRGREGGPPGGFGGEREAAAVPVEVTNVERRDMASYIETNGTLEAESEVDIVARSAGPIVELLAEETMAVRKGQLLARLDQEEIASRLEVSRVALQEAETAFERAETLRRANLVSSEEFDQARSRVESARAEFHGNEIQMAYTQIKAPFSGLIVERYVKFAENVAVNQPLFRLSDFDPLLCPIQVPERDLPRLAVGQPAYLTVDAWPDERFEARVLRLSPVVDAATGTVKVTLEVEAAGKLRPGMFGSIFLQTDTHEGALAIPKTALALDSIGDAVFVVDGATAKRRDITLGVREGDFVEVVSGLTQGELVVSVGQDSLSDGTPIEVLGPPGEKAMAAREAAGAPGGPGGRADGGGEMTPERLEMIKGRMRDRGMSDEDIERRLKEMRQRSGGEERSPSTEPVNPRGGAANDG